MNMWIGVEAHELCRQHLLGLHGELHKFLPSWRKRVGIAGRIAGNQMEPLSYERRHAEVAAEMAARGFNHKSPLETPDFSYLPPDQQLFVVREAGRAANRAELARRCPDCAKRLV